MLQVFTGLSQEFTRLLQLSSKFHTNNIKVSQKYGILKVEVNIMKVTYEALMIRRKEVALKIKTLTDKSVIQDLRDQIREIDQYIQKYYPEKVVSI